MFETRTFRGQSHVISPPLCGEVWKGQGVNNDNHLSEVIFDFSGKIYGSAEKIGYQWRIEKNILLILDAESNVIWNSVFLARNGNDIQEITLQSLIHRDQFFVLKKQEKSLSIDNLLDKTVDTKNTNIKTHINHDHLSDSDFLFPSDLARNFILPKNVLVVGSALAAFICQKWKILSAETSFDYFSYNMSGQAVDKLQNLSRKNYDCGFIQLPLRGILGDECIFAEQFRNPEFFSSIYDRGYEILQSMLEELINPFTDIKLPVFVSLFIVPQCDSARSLYERGGTTDIVEIIKKLNDHLVCLIKKFPNTYIVDTDAIASSIGKRYILDDTIYFYTHNSVFYQDEHDKNIQEYTMGQLPFQNLMPSRALDFANGLWKQIIAILRTVQEVDAIRLVVFDTDNVLWRGKAEENYIATEELRRDGWPTGVWEAIHVLRLRGIQVALGPSDGSIPSSDLWQKIVQPPFLSREDFLVLSDSEAKKNIFETLELLCQKSGIPEDEALYVTNNVRALDVLKEKLPKLRILHSNPYSIRRILLWSPELQVSQFHKNQSSIKNHATIKSSDHYMLQESDNNNVLIAEQNSLQENGFLNFLELKVKIQSVDYLDNIDKSGISKLKESSENFCATGVPWSKNDIENFLNSRGEVSIVYAKDRFVNYGIVGLLGVLNNGIIQFERSDRVLGLDIEDYILAMTILRLRKQDQNLPIQATLGVSSGAVACKELYLRAGFVETEDPFKLVLDDEREILLPPHIGVF